MFQRGCTAITIATWLVFPSCTRASHTAKINEAKFQMTMDSFGQYQKVQKCDSDASFVQVIVHIPQSITKRGQMRNLMVLRCSMVHLKSYHRLARLPHKWHTCNLVWGHVPIGVLAVHNHLIASALTQWWGGNRKSILNEVVHYTLQLHKTTHVSCLIIGIAVTFTYGDDKISE